MTNNETYQNFLNNQLTTDYQNWIKTATVEEIAGENATYTRLKLAAQFETIELQRLSQIEQEQQADLQLIKDAELIAEQEKQYNAIIQDIINSGYSGKATKEDFKKVMGDRYGSGTDYLISVWLEQGMSKFIQLWQQYK